MKDRPWWFPGESRYHGYLGVLPDEVEPEPEPAPEPVLREQDELVLEPYTRDGITTVQAIIKKKGTPRGPQPSV